MIFDRLNNSDKYEALNDKFKKAFDFLKTQDLKKLKDGKYLIDDENIFANVQTLITKDEAEKKWEAHRKYIDIQYVIRGKEKMGYGMFEDFKSSIPYDDKKDIEFLEGNTFNFINVNQGDFVVFYPQDVHSPMLKVEKNEEIKKVIIKIAI